MSTEEIKQHLACLQDRLQKYRQKDQVITQKEADLETARLEKEKLEKEREAIRLETEKQALILELQRVSMAKPAVPPPQKPIPPPVQQPVQQQAFFPSFNYPAMVTEKEAIDWLRNGF
ncbi:hypothetical protein INT47_010255 [Mucor saturninus]|uniref:Uncharacterized protein n=1 Tax=Mucor saturninus TaxID=64648 RepID=A0A8H7RBZ2_9FUNG|nr:hypothetical protein INT47_010255 [Mucor saturninus]